MPRLTDIWTLIEVDPRGLLTLLALAVAALALGRLLAGGLRALPVHDWTERGLVWVLVGGIAFSWTGTFLATLGLFRWWAVLLGLIVIVLLARRTLRGDRAGEISAAPLPPTPRLAVWAVLVLLAVALWTFARPAESFFLVDDSAVYTLGGIVLAREGDLMSRVASFWPATAEFARPFYVHNLSGTMSRFYGPFYQYFLAAPALEIGFLPLPKIWSALATWLLGPARATWSTPLFGVLGLATLYGLIRRAVSWQAALLATLLLGISLPQIWFSRYPISDMYAQATMLGGLYLALLARQNRAHTDLARQMAFWSAACLALWSLIRLEAVVLLPLLIIVLLAGWGWKSWSAQGYARTWLAAMALFSAAGWSISIAVNRYYLFDHSLGILNSRMTQRAMYAAVLLLLGSALAYRLRQHFLRSLHRRTGQIGRWLTLAMACVWVGSALAGLGMVFKGDIADSVPGWLAFYLSPLGVWLGIAGILWLTWRQFSDGHDNPELTALLLISGFLLILYSVNPRVAHWQPWGVRRLMPMILPALALGAGALLAWALQLRARRAVWGGRAWLAFGIAVPCLLAQVALEVRAARPILFHRELGGYAAQLQVIAAALPRDALLLFDDGETARGLPHAFELWLGYPSLALQDAPAGSAEVMLDTLIEKAQAENRPVLLVVTDGDLGWFSEKWDFVSRGVQQIEAAVLRPSNGRPPEIEDIVPRSYTMDLYEIVPRSENRAASSFALNASVGSYPYLRDGFYGWDQGAEGRIARWTDGSGSIVLPWPETDLAQPADICLKFALSGGRPESLPATRLTIQVEGVSVYDGALPKDFAPHDVRVVVEQVQNENLDELEVELVSTTWDTSAVGDGRTLGVLFYDLEVLPVAMCPVAQ
jgi:hypothetical protein